MSKQEILAKGLPAAAYGDFERNPRQFLAQRQRFALNTKRHQPRPRLDYSQTESAGNIISKATSAKLRNRQAAGGNHQGRSLQRASSRGKAKTIGMDNLPQRAIESNLDPGLGALVQQHFDNLACRTIAKQLSEGFFMIGDSMAFDQSDEIGWRVTAKGRLAKMWIDRKKPLRAHLAIGKITPPSTGNQDFRSHLRAMFKDANAPAPLAGGKGAHQAGRPRTNDHRVELFHLLKIIKRLLAKPGDC